jgi:two-component system, NarL family, sensor kinase
MRLPNRTIVCIAVLIAGCPLWIQAQSDSMYKSFENQKNIAIAELKKHPAPDTARVNALINVLNTATFLKERKELLPYREEAMQISRRLNYTKGIVTCYTSSGAYHKSASEYQTAIACYDSALSLIGDSQDPDLVSLKNIAHERKGMIYFAQENFYPALRNFFEAQKVAHGENLRRDIRVNSFIARSYLGLNNLTKAMEYAQRNAAIVEENQVGTADETEVYLALILISLQNDDVALAEKYLEKVGRYINEPGQVQVKFGYYIDKGHILYRQKKYSEAFLSYEQAYQLAIKGGHKASISSSLAKLSATALKMGNTEAAKIYAIENLELADSMSNKAPKMEALTNLAAYYHATGNDAKAYEAIADAMKLKDTMIADMNLKQVNLLSAMYDRETQEKQIEHLEREKEKQVASVKEQSMLNKFFVASILVLLGLGYLGYVNFRKGQKLARNQQLLQKQKIIELEKDKQLLSIDAMLKGQEEERSRIAKDLHDGLGGLLSGTKLSFMHVKEKIALSPENKVLFEKSLSMLDNTIGDLRKVAQNLMPEALVKFGLHEALRDFCNSIQSSSGIRIIYQQVGEPRKLDNTTEVFIFRIIQELVNNVIRHAQATQLIVQLAMNNKKIEITVEDNGKGFDKSMLANTKGSGMANINYRVQYLNGLSDIVTSPGGGTSINIQLSA